MNWTDVLRDKSLHDLPYKIELNERGLIEMSPATILHGMLQTAIADLLRDHIRGGRRITECPIDTRKGTKVPDVVWASREFMTTFGTQTPFPQAPEILVEVLSPSNTKDEILEKQNLYFERGAKEVWTCAANGQMRFYTETSELKQSILVPQFPSLVTLEDQ